MQKIKLTKKVIIELFVIAGLFLVLLFFAVSQKVAIGQKYQQVYFNGELVGNIAGHVSVDDAVHEVRRELAAESDEPLCMDYEYSSSKANDWFTPLMTEDALKEALKEKMKVSEIETQVRAYTVAIEGYRGNFKSMDEVTEFLNTVKNEADTEGQYTTQISKEAGHISGIYTAQLTEVDPKENTEVTPEVTLADQVSAGANGAFTYQMEYAMANPRDDSYETGTIGMEFIERVEVYEKYISGDALSDVEKQVEEGSFAVAQPQERVVYVNGEAPKPQPKPQLPKALKEDIKQVTSNFRKIANEASGMLRGYLKQARLSVDDQDRLLIVLPDEISASVVGSEEHKQELKDLIEKKIGKTVEIDVRQVENGRHFEDSFVDIEKVINMEITIEDE